MRRTRALRPRRAHNRRRAVEKRRATADTATMPLRLQPPRRLLAVAAIAVVAGAMLALPARSRAEP